MKLLRLLSSFFLITTVCISVFACGKVTQNADEAASIPPAEFFLDGSKENPYLKVLPDSVMDISGMDEEWLQSWEDELVLSYYGQILVDEGRELTTTEMDEYRRGLVRETWTKCHFSQQTDQESGTISIFVIVIGDEDEGEGFSMFYNSRKGVLLMKDSGEEFLQSSK